jgi:hypothetical protein
MIESNLVGGMQDPERRPLVYGQSITDGCLAWESTLPVLGNLAAAARARRTAVESGRAAEFAQARRERAGGPAAP